MPQAKFSKKFDYRVKRGTMYSYPANFEGEIPQAHFDAAAADGALEGVDKPAAAEDGKQGTGKQGGSTK